MSIEFNQRLAVVRLDTMKFSFKRKVLQFLLVNYIYSCTVSGYFTPTVPRNEDQDRFEKKFKSWFQNLAEETFGNRFSHFTGVGPNEESKFPIKRSNGSLPSNPLKELCSWKTLEWNLEQSSLCSKSNKHKYPPENKIPFGIQHTDNRIFVTVPRIREDIPSTLNVISRNDIDKDLTKECPKLNPYPSFNHNALHSICCTSIYDRFVSIWRLHVDQCESNPKLWFIDTGVADYPTQSIKYKQPTLNIINLSTDQVVLSRVIPNEVAQIPNGLKVVVPNIDPTDCESGYGYILDAYLGRIIVYSYVSDKFWVFQHNYFKLTPLESTFEVEDGDDIIEYQVNDNIYSLALDTYRDVAYVHARGSLTEFFVEISDLNNKTLASCLSDGINVKIAGRFTEGGQVGSHLQSDGTIWGVQEQKHGIFCMNAVKGFNASSYTLVASDPDTLPFIADLSLNQNKFLVLSNNYEQIRENGFNSNHKNFRIYEASIENLFTVAPLCKPATLKTREGSSKVMDLASPFDSTQAEDETATQAGKMLEDKENDDSELSAVKSGAKTRPKSPIVDEKLDFPPKNQTSPSLGPSKPPFGLEKTSKENELDANISKSNELPDIGNNIDGTEESAVLSGAGKRPGNNQEPSVFRSNTAESFPTKNSTGNETNSSQYSDSNSKYPNRAYNPNSIPIYQFFQGPNGNAIHEIQNSNQYRGGDGAEFISTGPRDSGNEPVRLQGRFANDEDTDTNQIRIPVGNSDDAVSWRDPGASQYIYLNIVNNCQQQMGCPFSDKCRALSLCSSFSEVKDMSPDLQEHLKKMCSEYLCSFCNYCGKKEEQIEEV